MRKAVVNWFWVELRRAAIALHSRKSLKALEEDAEGSTVLASRVVKDCGLEDAVLVQVFT